MHEGAAPVFPFSRESVVIFGSSLGKISREKPEKGVFFANGTQYPRYDAWFILLLRAFRRH